MKNIKKYEQFLNESWGLDGLAAKGMEWIKSKLSSVANAAKSIPLHIRACTRFVCLVTDGMTAEFLSLEELATLYHVICYTRTVKPNATSISYEDFSAYQTFIGDAENMDAQINTKIAPTGDFNPLTSSSLVNHLSMTLGKASVSKQGNTYTVRDTYDFNCIQNFPDAYKWENFPSTFLKNFKQIFGGQMVKGAEGMLSWYQKLGYTGYPVGIVVPRPANFVAPLIPKKKKGAKAPAPVKQTIGSFFAPKPAPVQQTIGSFLGGAQPKPGAVAAKGKPVSKPTKS